MLSLQQVADLLNVSTHSIERRVADNRMPPPLKVGKLNRWSRLALEAWIEAGCLPVRRTPRSLRISGGGSSLEAFHGALIYAPRCN